MFQTTTSAIIKDCRKIIILPMGKSHFVICAMSMREIWPIKHISITYNSRMSETTMG